MPSSEAKPERKQPMMVDPDSEEVIWQENDRRFGHNEAIDEYHSALKKIAEEI